MSVEFLAPATDSDKLSNVLEMKKTVFWLE